MGQSSSVFEKMIYTLEEKIGQMFAVGFDGLQAPDYLLDWLAQGRVGGAIFFGRNVQSPKQVAALTQSIHHAAKYPVVIGIDQEGGVVARLRQGFTESPGALALSAAAEGSEERTIRVSRSLGAEMHALGINWTYAPAVDILYNAHNPAVGTRSFGSDPMQVSKLAAAAVTGFQQGGVAACAKHFPGLGNTAIDTHLALPAIDTPLDELMTSDLLPYRAAIHADVASIMTTHTQYLTLDTEYPVTLSPIVVRRLLRDELKFDRVVTTDCMEMKAISTHYGPGEAAVLAVLAGIDLLLFSHTRAMQEAAYAAVLAAVKSGRIPEAMIDASVARVQAMKNRFPAQLSPDLNVIRQPEHLHIAAEAARTGMILLAGDLPVDIAEGAVLVEFISILESEVVEQGGQTALSKVVAQKAPQIATIPLKSVGEPSALQNALSRIDASDTLILATRNAHLIPEQLEQAQVLMRHAKRIIHICLRTPYDMLVLPGASVVLCTCGDSVPSLEAVADALAGEFTPTGQLRVDMNLSAL
jgi:beta-N-acetylhexosaminidase